MPAVSGREWWKWWSQAAKSEKTQLRVSFVFSEDLDPKRSRGDVLAGADSMLVVVRETARRSRVGIPLIYIVQCQYPGDTFWL